ncbi:PIN domain-containing protein [Oscillatoria amoena NRMC-F 0135]|nr:TA system VapC family ribonuclease toxin [Oscillatoria laete-virens]MDL5050602.1 PIN domain-containing protein [Oscillatoria amoena NRMC-F 0135]MDL5055616.1 PIN domain-containing protein [Oscillatoria laete-virens NRMC-F 0139]
MFVVDTNVLIYSADKDTPEHEPCRKLLESFRAQTTPWYLTWGIVYEFVRVVTHPRVLVRPFTPDQAWGFIHALFASPRLGILMETDRHRHVAAEVFAEIPGITGNLVFDAHTAILMRENGIRTIYTRDADFNRFSFVDTIDPLTNQHRTSKSRGKSKPR